MVDLQVLVQQVLQLLVLVVEIPRFLDQFLSIEQKLVILGQSLV